MSHIISFFIRLIKLDIHPSYFYFFFAKRIPPPLPDLILTLRDGPHVRVFSSEVVSEFGNDLGNEVCLGHPAAGTQMGGKWILAMELERAWVQAQRAVEGGDGGDRVRLQAGVHAFYRVIAD